MNLLQRNVKRLQNEKLFSISELRPWGSEQNKFFYHSSCPSVSVFIWVLFIYFFTSNVLHMKSFVFSIIKKTKKKKQYKIHSIAHNKSIALFQGTDETSSFLRMLQRHYRRSRPAMCRSDRGDRGAVGGVSERGQGVGSFSTFSSVVTRGWEVSWLKLLWLGSRMSGQCVWPLWVCLFLRSVWSF